MSSSPASSGSSSSSSSSSTSTSTSADVPESSISLRSLTSPRSRKQLSLFFAGATFLTVSALVTRRSLHRKYLAIKPAFYRPSNVQPAQKPNGAMEALEALNIATINVASFMMMVGGGLAWAFDVSTLDDLRRRVRGGLGVDGSGRSETDVEEEFEEWMAGVLDRKGRKEEERKRRKEAGEDGEAAAVTNERGKPRGA